MRTNFLTSDYRQITLGSRVLLNSTSLSSRLSAIVAEQPRIGCSDNPIPCKDLWNSGVDYGVGFATLYNQTKLTDYDISNGPVGPIYETLFNRGKWLRQEMRNNKLSFEDLPVEKQRIYTVTEDLTNLAKDHYVEAPNLDFSEEVRACIQDLKFSGFGATRSPADNGKIKFVYSVDAKDKTKIWYAGCILIMDTSALHDWLGIPPSSMKVGSGWQRYTYVGWQDKPLDWIVEISYDMGSRLPDGFSGGSTAIEGKPGVVLVDSSLVFESEGSFEPRNSQIGEPMPATPTPTPLEENLIQTPTSRKDVVQPANNATTTPSSSTSVCTCFGGTKCGSYAKFTINPPVCVRCSNKLFSKLEEDGTAVIWDKCLR